MANDPAPGQTAGQLIDGRAGVLDAVVEQPGAHAGDVELELRDDAGDRQRVGDVRISGAPGLALVGLGRELVGTADQAQVRVRIVTRDF